ncbi:MAG TPA: helix-turn-helix transcriptional regulator [Coriobacteriia bacterium]|nr:helix-turn-helix transcriptional regulator [Coriobacteriia bacterium]
MKSTGRNRPLYMISVAAELTGVHPQTLRIYERKALICPQRSGGNTRLYSESDIDRLRFIQHLTQDEGINLAGVTRIIDMQREMERMRIELEVTRQRLAQTERAIVAERSARQTHTALVRVRSGAVVHRRG